MKKPTSFACRLEVRENRGGRRQAIMTSPETWFNLEPSVAPWGPPNCSKCNPYIVVYKI